MAGEKTEEELAAEAAAAAAAEDDEPEQEGYVGGGFSDADVNDMDLLGSDEGMSLMDGSRPADTDDEDPGSGDDADEETEEEKEAKAKAAADAAAAAEEDPIVTQIRAELAASQKQNADLVEVMKGFKKTEDDDDDDDTDYDFTADLPTETDWADNPTEAAQRVAKIESEKLKAEARKDKKAEKARTDRAAAVVTTQQAGWKSALELEPELGTDKGMRDEMAKFYNNKELGLEDNPLGTFLAASAAFFIKHGGKVGSAAGGSAEALAAAKEEGAQAERERVARVGKGAMHGSGKGGGQASVSLTKEQKIMAKNLGVTEAAYAEEVKRLEA